MSVSHQPPLFYQQLPRFIASLPSQPVLYPAQSDSHYQSLVQSYLSHYSLDVLAQDKPHHYRIWKSTVDVSAQQELSDHYEIVQQCWEPITSSKGTVIICHGYFDHSGLYGRLIRWSLENHYRVLCFDLPGHGLSSGAPASIRYFETYSIVLNAVITLAREHKLLDKPVYAIGQSTGCAVIMNRLLQNHEDFIADKVILLAPLVRSQGWGALRWLYCVLKPLVPSIKRHFVPCSHNLSFLHFLAHHDPLQTRRLPLAWLGAMDSWVNTIKTQASQPCSYPLHIIQGTGDAAVDWPYNLAALQQAFSHCDIHYIDNAKHHLVNESDHYWQKIAQHLSTLTTT